MKKIVSTKKSVSKKKQNDETLKIFANFLRKSSAIMENALKQTQKNHPNLFKSS